MDKRNFDLIICISQHLSISVTLMIVIDSEYLRKIAFILGRADIQGGGSIYFGIQHGELQTEH